MGVGIVEDFRRCVTSDLKGKGDAIFLIGETRQEMGGSEYFRVARGTSGVAPDVDVGALRGGMDGLLAGIDAGDVAACHDLSQGGLAVAVAEMCLGGDLGADLDLGPTDPLRLDFLLFSETNARWLVEVKRGREDAFAGRFPVPASRIGHVTDDTLRIHRGRESLEVPVGELRDVWANALAREVVR
jgi:phosphoribosylformylglycinamidine synthase